MVYRLEMQEGVEIRRRKTPISASKLRDMTVISYKNAGTYIALVNSQFLEKYQEMTLRLNLYIGNNYKR